MSLTTWEVQPSPTVEGVLQLVRNGAPVLNLGRALADNGEEYAMRPDEFEKFVKHIASQLMVAEVLGQGGRL